MNTLNPLNFEEIYQGNLGGYIPTEFRLAEADGGDWYWFIKSTLKNRMYGVTMMERKKGHLPDVRIDKVTIDIQAGDYVRYRNNEYSSVFIASNVKDGIVYNGEWDYYHDEPDGNPIIFCSKWEPEESELCWFWDTRDNLTVREFEEMYQSKFKPKGAVMGYKYCEPFLGERPSLLNDNEWKLYWLFFQIRINFYAVIVAHS